MTVHERRSRGVGFEQYNPPRLRTADGIAEIDGDYPAEGIGERAAWFRDSEGNVPGIAQPVLPRKAAADEQQIRDLITQSPVAVHARDIRAPMSGDKQHRAAKRATLSQRTSRERPRRLTSRSRIRGQANARGPEAAG